MERPRKRWRGIGDDVRVGYEEERSVVLGEGTELEGGKARVSGLKERALVNEADGAGVARGGRAEAEHCADEAPVAVEEGRAREEEE